MRRSLIGWARSGSASFLVWPCGCCDADLGEVLGIEGEVARVGPGRPAADPAAADVLIVAGAVTRRQAPLLVETWRRMSAPRWVVALGACACGGGMWKGDATLPGLESVLPVDIFIPGCPPPREAVLEGLRALATRIRAGRDEALRPSVGRVSAG